ncbi:MAG: hypothetical protein A2Y33_03775 [Spirochaetes bacterium GWF1_51_8]|nr:MAG: hypothetical protein A2Y33_03775 [Spirochaetes bacterium GWF1_51_8]
MNVLTVFLITAGALMAIGVFGILTRSNIIKILLSINILQTGVNLLLIALGYRDGGAAPIITSQVSSAVAMVDPLPQALVLTSIVIAFGTTAVGLVICLNYYMTHKSLDVHTFGNEEREHQQKEVVD